MPIGRECKLYELEQEMSAFSGRIRQMRQSSNLNHVGFHHQVVLNLMGKSADPRKIVGAAYDAENQLPEQIAKNNRSIVMNIYMYTMYLNFLFGDSSICAWKFSLLQGVPGRRRGRVYIVYVSVL
jgi:predicted ATPase